MRKLRALLSRLGGLFGKARHERELAAEMDSHIALHDPMVALRYE
jgi:hypothetical protein